jgi:hypothetical protein
MAVMSRVLASVLLAVSLPACSSSQPASPEGGMMLDDGGHADTGRSRRDAGGGVDASHGEAAARDGGRDSTTDSGTDTWRTRLGGRLRAPRFWHGLGTARQRCVVRRE